MAALKLSKVPRAATPMVARRAPFVASGLTHSNALKSGGYLSSPKADRPCLGPSAVTPMVAPGAARMSKMASNAADFGWSMKTRSHGRPHDRDLAQSRGRNGPKGQTRAHSALFDPLGPL